MLKTRVEGDRSVRGAKQRIRSIVTTYVKGMDEVEARIIRNLTEDWAFLRRRDQVPTHVGNLESRRRCGVKPYGFRLHPTEPGQSSFLAAACHQLHPEAQAKHRGLLLPCFSVQRIDEAGLS